MLPEITSRYVSVFSTYGARTYLFGGSTTLSKFALRTVLSNVTAKSKWRKIIPFLVGCTTIGSQEVIVRFNQEKNKWRGANSLSCGTREQCGNGTVLVHDEIAQILRYTKTT